MTESTTWRRQLQLWLILGITATALAAGFVLLPRDEAGKVRLLAVLGTSNHGQLLMPAVPIAALPLTSSSGMNESWGTDESRWRMVVMAPAPCAEQCRDALYLTRQVHVRLGRNADRIERVFVVVGNEVAPEIAELIAREHPQLRVLLVKPELLAQWPGAMQMQWNGAEPRVVVIDPQGAAMLYFTPAHDGADLLADLNHLLRYSPGPKS